MKDFIMSVLKVHCTIYKKDFKYYSLKFLDKNQSEKDNFIFEFINIYKDYDIYEEKFLIIKKVSQDKFKSFRKRENFLLIIEKEINLEF